jgi:hypothetical protein
MVTDEVLTTFAEKCTAATYEELEAGLAELGDASPELRALIQNELDARRNNGNDN